MMFLETVKTCAIAVLSTTGTPGEPLVEKIRPHMEISPCLLLDGGDINFSSMQIGELVNLVKAFDARWQGQQHGLALFNVSKVSADSFRVAGINQLLPVFDSVSQALASFG
ncbi:MAG: hypothetical protein V3S29_09030 [bacterium]